MKWTTLIALTESTLFRIVGAFLFVVPFLAKMGFSLAPDSLCLYAAGFLLAVASAIYYLRKPGLFKHHDFDSFSKSGRGPSYLAQAVAEIVPDLENVENIHVRTKLINKHNAADADKQTFTFVHDKLDSSRTKSRYTLTLLYSCVFALLIAVNLYRLYIVCNTALKN